MISLTVNGVQHEVPEGATVVGLLAHLKKDTQPAAVEVNKRLVPKREHAACILHAGDVVEVVTLVGGG